MKQKKMLKVGLFAFLMVAVVVSAFADPARVVSKQENLPHVNGNLKTRILLDITPNDDDNRADAYVDIPNTNRSMSMQEFSDMIKTGDIIEYMPGSQVKNGRYIVINSINLLELNGENIYKIFLENMEDGVIGYFFHASRQAYEAKQQTSSR